MKEFMLFILGSCWEVRVRDKNTESRLAECQGFTDWTDRAIVINDSRDISNLRNPEMYMKKALRHEIVHAFMFESGLGDDWQHEPMGHDETVVDWIGWNIPKLWAVCKEAEKQLMEVLEGESCLTD